MSILMFIVLGLVAGLIARAIMPGKQSMGLIATALVGIAGSFLGGLVGSLFSGRALTSFSTAGVIGSILGAVAVLFIMGAVGRRRGVTRSYV